MRLRVAASYVAFTTVLMAAIGVFLEWEFRQEVEVTAREAVEADYGAALGFLHIDNDRPEWVYNQDDPNETRAVERLRNVYQLTGPDGKIVEESRSFALIKTIRPAFNPQFAIVRDEQNAPYAIRASWIHDARDRRYGLAIGRSLTGAYRRADRVAESYAILMLPILALTSLFSWWIAGVAMRKR